MLLMTTDSNFNFSPCVCKNKQNVLLKWSKSVLGGWTSGCVSQTLFLWVDSSLCKQLLSFFFFLVCLCSLCESYRVCKSWQALPDWMLLCLCDIYVLWLNLVYIAVSCLIDFFFDLKLLFMLMLKCHSMSWHHHSYNIVLKKKKLAVIWYC